MGFSPQDALVALAATDTGLDVQTALEILISNAPPEQNVAPAMTGREPDVPPDRRRHREHHPSSSQLQDQADKLLTQASGLGLSMFNKANALWASGKDRAIRAYEERTKPVIGAGARPKWMQSREHEEMENEGEGSTLSNHSRVPEPFSDAYDEPKTYDEPKMYMSPFRRGPPPPPAPSSSSASVAPSPPRDPSPVPRQLPHASTEALSTSAKHKADGNDKFKLGQYADAEAAYTIAIDTLPSGHLLLIPLHNNRASTRLKIGDYAGAAADAGQAITIIGPSFDPTSDRIANVDAAAGGSVDLCDGFVKALRRRAEALEGRERWSEARKDWETLACCAWASGNTRSEGLRGVDRCRHLVVASDDANDDASLHHSTRKPRTHPKPPPQAIRRGSTPTPPALANLRVAMSALEAQENARYELKDTVDARLTAWKAGKENNIRALVASLDTVLWPELGWVKVGMGELVSEKQVKIRYTKAIAKVHPDKVCSFPFAFLSKGVARVHSPLKQLNASTTLEQRMIANGVFGTLNDAWNVFKP
jgi:tetratricopeptide (TPR) repeat protein